MPSDERTPYEIEERKKDAAYVAGLIESEPWPEMLEKIEAWIKLREVRDAE